MESVWSPTCRTKSVPAWHLYSSEVSLLLNNRERTSNDELLDAEAVIPPSGGQKSLQGLELVSAK
jgi:hypothetical protein